MGRKTPISFNLQKYVEKHCNGTQWVHSKTRKQGKLQHRLHCSWFDWLFRRWLSKDQNTDWKKKCLCLWKIFHWLKIDLFLVFFMNFIWKNNVLAICIFYWIPKPNSLLPELFSYIILKQIFHTEDTSVSLFWGGMFPNRLKTLF